MTRLATLYRRVSSEHQVKHGVSLDVQDSQLFDYCRFRGWTVSESGIFADEGISGRDMDTRPGLLAALDEVCCNQGVLVVPTLSRLARSVRDADAIRRRLEQCGGDLALVNMQIDTSTASGKLVFHMIAAMAEFESDQMGERISAALRHMKSVSGFNPTAHQTYGWRAKKVYDENQRVRHYRVPHEPEQIVLERIHWMYSAGMNWQAIANALNSLQVPTPRASRLAERGKPAPAGLAWRRSTVLRLYRASQRVSGETILGHGELSPSNEDRQGDQE
jgi:site-specific DNA recombinase